jgi:3-oxoadipate enol-lactonase
VLSEVFRRDQPDVVDGIVAWRAGRTPDEPADEPGAGGDAPLEGWRAQAAALASADLRDELVEVTDPALVVHGTHDDVWPVAGGEALADGLPRGRFEPVEGGPHLVGVEHSRTVDDLLVGFLDEKVE